MTRLSEEVIRKIRTKPWYKNEQNVILHQTVIEEAVRSLRLTKCPVCKGDLSNKDNFGVGLPKNETFEEKYCPKDNYIIQLQAHQYKGNTQGTSLHMYIFSNSRHSVLLADSGELADISQCIGLSF